MEIPQKNENIESIEINFDLKTYSQEVMVTAIPNIINTYPLSLSCNDSFDEILPKLVPKNVFFP